MFHLIGILYSLVATALAGTGVVAALVSGYATLGPILAMASAGAVLAAPVSYLVARKLHGPSLKQ